MRATEIIDKLNTGNYLIEHTAKESAGQTIIIGYLQEKNDSSGYGRHEFALKERPEQEVFINGYSDFIKSIIG